MTSFEFATLNDVVSYEDKIQNEKIKGLNHWIQGCHKPGVPCRQLPLLVQRACILGLMALGTPKRIVAGEVGLTYL